MQQMLYSKQTLLCDWLQGLADLHSAGMTPGDFKVDNFDVDLSKLSGGQSPLAKLIDFGFATHGTLHCSPVQSCMPQPWTVPSFHLFQPQCMF